MSASRWTWHGGGLGAARAHYGGEGKDWLDLSTGINPHAWPGADSTSIDWRSLPDEQALRALEQAAAAYFGCNADHVCAVPGTEMALRIAGELLAPPARHVAPGYLTHGEMLAASMPVPIDRLFEADGSTLIIANPNNPDGRLICRAKLMDLLGRRGDRGWLVLDEAFADCHPNNSLAGAVDDSRRLLIFRSFGKFFGLAGLRLGFVLGPRDLIARVRRRLGAWPVSAAAIVIGTAAYRDSEWIFQMRIRLRAEAAKLDGSLQERGYAVMGDCPLFRLIHCQAARPLFEYLAQRFILTRPFEDHPSWLRVGLPETTEALSRYISALPDHD